MLEAFVHLFDASKSLHSFSRLSGWLRRSHGSAVQFRDIGRHSPPLPSSGVVVVVHCHVQVGVPDGLHPFVHPVQGCQKLPSAADGGGGDDGSLVVVVVFRLLLVVENEAETNGHFEIGFRIRSVHGQQKSVREQQQREQRRQVFGQLLFQRLWQLRQRFDVAAVDDDRRRSDDQSRKFQQRYGRRPLFNSVESMTISRFNNKKKSSKRTIIISSISSFPFLKPLLIRIHMIDICMLYYVCVNGDF